MEYPLPFLEVPIYYSLLPLWNLNHLQRTRRISSLGNSSLQNSLQLNEQESVMGSISNWLTRRFSQRDSHCRRSIPQ